MDSRITLSPITHPRTRPSKQEIERAIYIVTDSYLSHIPYCRKEKKERRRRGAEGGTRFNKDTSLDYLYVLTVLTKTL